MKSTGNIASNKTYNPRNVRPTIPLDPDEVDISVEKHIREKYQRRTLGDVTSIARNNTGSTATTASTEDRPPPPPPKPNARFGPDLRSTSAAYPSPYSSGRSSPATTAGRDPSVLENKSLPPLPRNATAVQSFSNVSTPASAHNFPTYGQPVHAPQPTIQHAPQPTYHTQGSAAQSTSYGGGNPFYQQMSYQQQSQPLEVSLHNMQIQQTALTPEATGGWQQQVAANNPFLQSYTPPLSPPPPSHMYNQSAAQVSFGEQISNGQANQSSTNPFMHLSRSHTMPNVSMQNGSLYDATAQPGAATTNQFHLPLLSPSTNPFYSHTQVSSPAAVQQEQQHTPQAQQYQQPQYQWPNTVSNQNIQAIQPQDYTSDQQTYVNPARHDKSSILALYGQPHLAPARPILSESASQGGAEEPAIQNIKRRSVTMPVSISGHTPGSKNPFASTAPAEQSEGVNGGQKDDNHYRSPSPDAFRSLSSTFK